VHPPKKSEVPSNPCCWLPQIFGNAVAGGLSGPAPQKSSETDHFLVSNWDGIVSETIFSGYIIFVTGRLVIGFFFRAV